MEDNSVCRVYLIRHGETANAGRNCFNGHFDVDLSPLGLEQMRQVSQALKDKPIRSVYTSDLRRAREGARIIGEPHGREPISSSKFRELSVGKWEGLSVDEVNRKYPGEIQSRLANMVSSRVEGGETLHEMQARVLPAFREAAENHLNESIALVSHGGVNRVILCHVLGIPLKYIYRIQQDFAAINIVRLYKGTGMVELVNGSPLHVP
ncbi:MAG: histidine phosphatase family protein [Nitrospinales bacterium]